MAYHKSPKKETHYNKSEGPARKSSGDRPTRGGSDKPYSKRDEGDKKPFQKRDDARPSYGKRTEGSDNAKPYQKRNEGDRPFNNRESGSGERPFRPRRDEGAKPYSGRSTGDKPYQKREGGDRPFNNREGAKPYGSRPSGEKPYEKREGDRAQGKAYGDKPFKKPEENGDRWEGRSYGEKPFKKRETGDRPQGKTYGDKPYQKREEGDRPQRKSFGDKPAYGEGKPPYQKRGEGDNRGGEQRPYRKPFGEKKEFLKGEKGGAFHSESPTGRKRITRPGEGDERRERAAKTYSKRTNFDRDDIWQHDDEEGHGKWDEEAKAGPMTLNKYLAHAGVSSRRDAAIMVKEGKVQVNGEVVKQPGYRVQEKDVITLDGKTMTPQRHHVYILLNKPKDFITTTEDDKGRRTVMDLVASSGVEKLYPVGRLDRNTTGVLLMTNDGDLAQKLSHPSYDTKKIYQVTLDKNVTKADFDKMLDGVELEDGKAIVDRLSYLENKNEIGLEIHSGRNRIVRRIFEKLGYDVQKLDRVMYAGLTKKNVSRGKWRFLNDKEITFLKHFKTR